MLVLANILQPLIDLNEWILRFWHNDVGLSWGASIIGLTIVIRLAILPLTFKQVRSMQEMQRFSPEMKRIRDQYKDDKTRQNEELMKLYKEHGFNPLGSCLPLVLQLPFFFGLYQTLRSTGFKEEVGGGGQFFFIPDITKPLSGHTAALVVMIVLYVGTQLASSYVSSLNVQDANQRRILFIFPFVFVPVVIHFQAGLLLYWVTTNVFTVTQQLAIRKFLPAPVPHVGVGDGKDGKRGGGGAAGGKAGKGTGGDGGGPPERTSRKRGALARALAAAEGKGASAAATDGRGAADGKQAGGDAKRSTGDGKATAAKRQPKPKAAAGKEAKAGNGSDGKSNGGPRKSPPPSPRTKKKRTGRRR
jgi:YidC/Oxa1 family membrane protein insertase